MNSRHRFHIFYQYIKDLSSQILEPTYIKIFTMHLIATAAVVPAVSLLTVFSKFYDVFQILWRNHLGGCDKC